jgi:hypothetical protein
MRRVVFVCRRCGKGFLTYPGQRDPDPVWVVLQGHMRIVGEDCFGEIEREIIHDAHDD